MRATSANSCRGAWLRVQLFRCAAETAATKPLLGMKSVGFHSLPLGGASSLAVPAKVGCASHLLVPSITLRTDFPGRNEIQDFSGYCFVWGQPDYRVCYFSQRFFHRDRRGAGQTSHWSFHGHIERGTLAGRPRSVCHTGKGTWRRCAGSISEQRRHASN